MASKNYRVLVLELVW